MVFTTPIFLFYFLPLFVVLYAAVGRRLRIPLLTIFSYAFYGWWDPRFLGLLMFSTAIDYLCGLGIDRA